MSVNENNHINQYPDEINLKEILFTLVENKKIIFMVTGLFTLGAIIFSLSVSEKWYSSSLLSPVSSGGASSSKSSGLSALGINLSKGGVTPSSKAVATISSRDFLNHLLTHDGVLENLMAFKAYDRSSQQPSFNSSLYDSNLGKWVEGKKPTDYQAFIVYNSMLSVTVDKFTNFLTISVEHGSPIFAKNFLDLIIQEVNNLSRQRDLEQSAESLAYLYDQLSSVQQSDVRQAVTQLIEGQLKKQMMANVAKNYILQPIDSPYIPELRSYPQRTKMVVAYTLFGFLLSLMFIIARHYTLRYFK